MLIGKSGAWPELSLNKIYIEDNAFLQWGCGLFCLVMGYWGLADFVGDFRRLICKLLILSWL